MVKISEQTALGDLVDAHPLASGVLIKYDLDFCCGGQQSLGDACKASSLDPEVVLRELSPTTAQSAHRPWSKATNEELIRHIRHNYHKPLHKRLSRLEKLADRVSKRHGGPEPDRLTDLRDAVYYLAQDLRSHVKKEEGILFPWILEGHQPAPVGPVQCMLMDHEHVSVMLGKIYSLTDGHRPPMDACRTWRALYLDLKQFDTEVRAHIHLENNILFVRVLQ